MLHLLQNSYKFWLISSYECHVIVVCFKLNIFMTEFITVGHKFNVNKQQLHIFVFAKSANGLFIVEEQYNVVVRAWSLEQNYLDLKLGSILFDSLLRCINSVNQLYMSSCIFSANLEPYSIDQQLSLKNLLQPKIFIRIFGLEFLHPF